ncbi:helix-turn-helix domain-containing protein [Raoultella sp. T31]|uniref:helix-turn-helix domain-containing protein n=1 Tax=Raoultella sp. T31 TaxID=2054594 RepID=UPI000C292A81|nr:AraC family transcriptional regulator [Raoultella sp. T31]
MNIWSTDNVTPCEKFSYWREVLCQAYTALDPVVSSASGFSGTVTSGKLADVDVTSISSLAQRINRGYDEIRRMPNEYYFLNLQICGQCLMQQGNNTALINPGEFSLVDSTRPYINDYLTDDFKQLSFRIPQSLLKPLLLHPDAILTSKFAPDGGIFTITIDFLKTIASTDLSYHGIVQTKLMENLVSLVGLSLGINSRSYDKVTQTYQEQLYISIKKYVRENLSDPELGPIKVANNFRISTRYLHKIFEQGAESFSRFLQNERLDKCASELKYIKSDSVSTIAFRAGFNDTSHFSKVFRQQFGQSPRDYRKENQQ